MNVHVKFSLSSFYNNSNFNVHTDIQAEGQADGFDLIDLASDSDKEYNLVVNLEPPTMRLKNKGRQNPMLKNYIPCRVIQLFFCLLHIVHFHLVSIQFFG